MQNRSIAQGCSEYNITVLIDQKDSIKALSAVHARFYLAQLPLALGIVGPGAIGATLLEQLHQQAQVSPQKLSCRQIHCLWMNFRMQI